MSAQLDFTIFTSPEPTRARVVEMHNGIKETTVPEHRATKMVEAAYHPGDIVRAALRYLSSELELGQVPARPTEVEILQEYRNTWNPKPGMDFYHWVQLVLSSEMAARAFRTEDFYPR